MDETPKTISSPQTFLVKFFLPLLWIVGFGFGTFAVWSSALVSTSGQPAPEAVKYAYLALWIVIALVIYRQVGRLKRVRMDSRNLYVSDYRREETIPLGQIAAVASNDWRSDKRITLLLRSPCAFGDEILFIPPKRLAFWRPSPVVAELKRRAGLAD